MARAFQKSLETHAIGETLNWSNADTGQRGTVTPLYAYQNDAGQDCRDYQQTITVEAKTEITLGAACRLGADWVDTGDAEVKAVTGNGPSGRFGYRYYRYPYFYGYPYYASLHGHGHIRHHGGHRGHHGGHHGHAVHGGGHAGHHGGHHGHAVHSGGHVGHSGGHSGGHAGHSGGHSGGHAGHSGGHSGHGGGH